MFETSKAQIRLLETLHTPKDYSDHHLHGRRGAYEANSPHLKQADKISIFSLNEF